MSTTSDPSDHTPLSSAQRFPTATAAARRDDESAPFFDAAGRGELVVRRCAQCRHLRAPEVRGCPRCYDGAFTWSAVSGRATLVSWAVAHERQPDGETLTKPFALVELEEGPWITAPLVDVAIDTVAAGDALHVRFVRLGGGEAIPSFTREVSPAGD